MAIKTEICENCDMPVAPKDVSRVDTVDGVKYVCLECAPEFKAENKEDERQRND